MPGTTFFIRKSLFVLALLCSLNSCEKVTKEENIAHSSENELQKVPALNPPAELKKHRFAQAHLGTVVHLVFFARGDELVEEAAENLSKKCFQRVRDLDATLSDYRADSEVSRLCKKKIGIPHKVSDELFAVVSQAQQISTKTDGAFDITLGKHTKSWREKSRNRSAPVIEGSELIKEVSYHDLTLNKADQTITLLKPLAIDLGGIGKGYIADQLMLILNQAKISHAAVIIGGETVLANAPPGKNGWKIGIENPEHQVIGTLELANTALSTSGDSYQFFEDDGKRKSHIIDPATKKSMMNRLNVTTIAPSSILADAWATALRVLPTDKALEIANKQPDLKALFIPYRKVASRTENFPKLTERLF